MKMSFSGQGGPIPLAVCTQLTRAISRSDELTEIYDAALAALEAALHVRRASILLFDSDGILRFKAWRGLSAEHRAAVEGHSPWARGARAADAIVVSNVSVDAGLAPSLPSIRAEKIAALAFVPLEGA